jgi:DNA-binding beta-propeller fold protein YncE
MGAIKIKLPTGFVIDSAEAVRSTADVKFEPADVVISADGNSAYVTLPASNILSVRFTK